MMTRMKRRLRRGLKSAADAAIGVLAVGLLKSLRIVNPDKMANFAGRLLRAIGPLLPENKIGRANLTAAFPEKSDFIRVLSALIRGKCRF